MWNNGRRAAVPSGDRASVNIVEYPVSDESCKQEANGVRWWIVMIAAFAAGGGHARTAASTPAYSVKDLVALAKSRPGEINFASSGTGGAPHLAGELLKIVAGIIRNEIVKWGRVVKAAGLRVD